MTEAMPVKIRGKVYKNAGAAAKALGVKRSTIYSALYRNTLDTVGLGTGKHKKNPRGGRPRPVKIGDMQFPTLRAASVYLGYQERSLSRILARGGARSKANIMRRFLEQKARVENQAMRARMINA